MAVFNLNTGIWKVDLATDIQEQWGATALGDLPLPGDYDGDGKADMAVFRSSTGGWFIMNSSGGTSGFVWPNPPNASDIVYLP